MIAVLVVTAAAAAGPLARACMDVASGRHREHCMVIMMDCAGGVDMENSIASAGEGKSPGGRRRRRRRRR